MIQFVANYEDLSTDKGFQFKFHCDQCHNGYMSRFQPSTMGIAGSLLNAASSLFGGLGGVESAAYQIQQAVGGKAHDAALETAVAEGKQNFKQCTRCGHWVCPDVCWNANAGLCEACAPDEQGSCGPSRPKPRASKSAPKPAPRTTPRTWIFLVATPCNSAPTARPN